MGPSGNTRGRRRLVADINVTPLVDVMLVLLIIFMVTAPMMTQGLEVDLPEATTKALPQQEVPLVVTVKKEGVVSLGNEILTPASLLQQLKAMPPEAKKKGIYLKADKTIPYGVVTKIMADIHAAGFDKLGMITIPAERNK